MRSFMAKRRGAAGAMNQPTEYVPPMPDLFVGYQPFNPGVSGGPRVSAIGEIEANCPKPWPVQYGWRLMGVGAMPLFQLGYTAPVFNNQMSPYPFGYSTMMPGLGKLPYGG